jgi:protocatechuate 3,4-dioxygenase beta subunit
MRTSLVVLALLLLAAPSYAKEPGGSALVLAGAKEPGNRMVIAGRIWKADGKKPAGAERVLVYHTDARGDYGSRPGATPAQGRRDARLSGYVTTDPEGRFEVRTIRPGPYPAGNIPAHVHFVLGGSNLELQFADDPRVDATDRKNMTRDGTFAMVRPVTVDAQGVQRVSREFRLPR